MNTYKQYRFKKSAKLSRCLMMFMMVLSLGNGVSMATDIRHYDIHIVPDFSTHTINLTATIEIENQELQHAFVFGLNEHYSSFDVKANNSQVTVKKKGGWMTVTVEKPSRELILTFNLKGYLGRSNDERREIVTDNSLFLLWSDRFYPIVFDDWATVKTTIVLPKGYQALAPGRVAEVVNAENKITYIFETTHPTVCFSVLADRKWICTGKTINNIPMQTLLYPESQHFAEQIFLSSAEILAFYSDYYGPYSFDQFSFVTIEGMNARRAFPGFIGYNPKYLEKEFTTIGHDAHETALLWWFYTLRGSGAGAFQWSEGFGDYAEFLYNEKYQKPIPSIFRYFRAQYIASDSTEDVSYEELKGSSPQKIVHGKYPWLMHLIRYVVGDDAFRQAMHLLFERFRFGTFSIVEFIQTLEDGTRQSLQWWRKDWLQRKGAPTVMMRYNIQQQYGIYKTTVVLEQSDPPRYLPVEIGIETDENIRFERMVLTEKSKTAVFTTEEKPKRIVLDPNGWLLAKKVVLNQ